MSNFSNSSIFITTINSLTSVSGLFLWNDASDLSTIKYHSTSGKLSAWNDKSGSNRHFIQTNTSNQPSYISAASSNGGRPAVRFQSSNTTYMQNISSNNFNSIQGPFTFFAIIHNNINNGFVDIISQSSNNTLRRRLQFRINGDVPNNMETFNGPGDNYRLTYNYSGSLSTKSLFTFAVQTSTKANYYIDGVKYAAALNGYSPLQLTGTTTSTLYMGNSQGFGYYIEGTVDAEYTEIALFNRVLTDDEIYSINNYFSTKYSNLSSLKTIDSNSYIKTLPSSTIFYPASAIAYWGFDYSSWFDSTGNGNKLYLNGSAILSSGKINKCAVVDNNSYFSAPRAFDFSGNFAISVWVYPTRIPSFRSLIISPSNLNYSGLQFYINDGSDANGYPFIGFDSPNVAGPYYGTAHINLNQWNHVVLTRTSGNIRTYVNGVLDQNRSDVRNYSCSINIGGNNYNYDNAWIVGGIDELAIFKNGLSPADVSTLYNNGNGYVGNNVLSLQSNAQIIGSNLILTRPINPIAFWTFNGTNPNSVPSVSGTPTYTLQTGNDGRGSVNAGSIVTGKIGNAIGFGTSGNQGLFIPSGTFPILTTFTITAWVKLNALNSNFSLICNSWDGGGWNFIFGINNSGRLTGNVGIGGVTVQSDISDTYVNFNDGNWHFCVFQCLDNNYYRVKVDNYPFTSVSLPGSLAGASARPFQIGQNIAQSIYNFNGAIDMLGIWTRVLSVNELYYLYNNGNGTES